MTAPLLIRRSSEPLFLQSARALYLPEDWKVVLKIYITNLSAKPFAQLHAQGHRTLTIYFSGQCDSFAGTSNHGTLCD